jgi:hypothetical protein
LISSGLHSLIKVVRGSDTEVIQESARSLWNGTELSHHAQAIHQYSTLLHLAGHESIDNALHRLSGCPGRNAEEFAAMSAMAREAAKYLVAFPHHLLDHPMDVGKCGTKRANHLFKTFAPLLLARKRVELHEIKGHKIVYHSSRP